MQLAYNSLHDAPLVVGIGQKQYIIAIELLLVVLSLKEILDRLGMYFMQAIGILFMELKKKKHKKNRS